MNHKKWPSLPRVRTSELSDQPNRRLWKVIGMIMNAGKQKGYDNKNKRATKRKRTSPYQMMLESIENSFRKSKVECQFKAGFFHTLPTLTCFNLALRSIM